MTLFLVANAAWEGTFAAARTFVVLYITVGLGQPLSTSAITLAVVSGGYLVAALVAGRLGDRIGLAPVIVVASLVYGGGYMVGGLATEWHDWYLPVIFPIAIAGGIVMTLAWGLLFKLMPQQHRGAISGLATTTKGIGLLIGPLVAGAAIDILRPHLASTDGYQVLWPICGLPILAVVPLVARLIPDREERERCRSGLTRASTSWRSSRGRSHALYEHWERNQWSLFDLDFNVDAESYARLDDEAARASAGSSPHRFDAEWEVARPAAAVRHRRARLRGAARARHPAVRRAPPPPGRAAHLRRGLRRARVRRGAGAGGVQQRPGRRRASTASSRTYVERLADDQSPRCSSARSSPTTCSPRASSPARRRTSPATSTRASATSPG